jgi:hypothetical protein
MWLGSVLLQCPLHPCVELVTTHGARACPEKIRGGPIQAYRDMKPLKFLFHLALFYILQLQYLI